MILLTGATGKTGGETAKALLAKGVKIRALVRSPEKAAALKAAGAELVAGDVSDSAALAKALAGVDRALLILPNGEQQLALEKQFTDAAKQAGVKHLVKMSSMEAVADAKSPIPRAHWASEEYIRASGLTWTMIKPNFFMQNLLAFAGPIKEQSKFFLPMGKGQTVMIDARDIGAVAAAVLSGDGHEGQSYQVTGPEVLNFTDVADRFTKVLGRKIEYVDIPMDAYREKLSHVLTSKWHLNAVCELFGEIAECPLLEVTDTVKRLTGRDPRPLRQFIEDHRAAFGG